MKRALLVTCLVMILTICAIVYAQGSAIPHPMGLDTYIQYNNGGIFGGDATFNFNDTTKVVDMDGLTITGTIATGLDMSGGTFATAVQNWPANPVINVAGLRSIKFDNTNYNMFLGTYSFNNADGQFNVGIGYGTGFNNDTTGAGSEGDLNTYIGYRAGYGATGGVKNTGYFNMGLGSYASYYNTSGNYVTAVGYSACYRNTSGLRLTAIGSTALYNNAGGSYGTAIGSEALWGNTSGVGCTAVGYEASKWNQTGNFNTAVGYLADGLHAYAYNSHSNQTVLGAYAGYDMTTGGSCVLLGYKAGWKQTTNSNLLIIDNQDRTSAALEITNSLIYGVFHATPASQSLRINAGTFILGNPTHADTEGAGAVLIQGIREDGAGTASIAGQIEISHDGAVANDQLGKIIESVNTGAGLVESRRVNSDLSQTFAGDVIIGAAGNLEKVTNDLTLTTAANKTLVMSQSVYDDLQFQVSNAKVTPNNLLPSWEAFTTNTSEYAFAIDEEVDTQANELPHWWKEGTAGHAHIHITTKAVPAQEQKARFTVTFAYADTGEVWVEAPLTAELTIPISTTALTHFYLDLGDLTLTNYLVGAQIRCRIKRVAKSAGGTEYVGDIFITQVGIHLEKTRLGSRNETTS